MLSCYFRAAMARARYEILPDGTHYGELLDYQGVWANSPTLEGCQAELREVLEDWVALRQANGMPLPTELWESR